MAAAKVHDLTNGSGRQRAYTEIRARILRLEFSPGAELEEGALCTLLGLSRTPIREALIRLASEGLVVLQRGRGARVAPLDISNLRTFFEALDLLQRAVSRLAALRRTGEDLAAIEPHIQAFEESGKRVESLDMAESNYRFHMAIAVAAHSEYLERSYSRVMTEGLRVARVCFSEENDREAPPLSAHVDRTTSEHHALYNALLQQDADEAERLAAEHTILFRNRVAQTLIPIDGLLSHLRV
ncbi:GntR family transcriptional regulator [Aquibaculum arenosum]|uniref:GntR family transcriptional regulator n=1 Tax=Aquibaculum arenosum TaxID=3032591 RepID=A0ABT5YMD3_9PROT|nr:GntR family transcriptional regulator [Fodinicurvata sp. CAU 1616]MDF2096003.1 GntR family transcriptional regulator [Fodinicurvata sp. CAU 1616]